MERPPTNHPPARPLHPLAQIMRMQHILEQPVLRHHVYLAHALDSRSILLGLARLLAPRGAPDLAQVVVVEHIPQQAPAPDHEPDEHVFGARGPVVLGCWPVAREVAADGERVGDLEDEGHEPDERVDGGHAGVEKERGEDRAVEVVYDLDAVSMLKYEVCAVKFVRRVVVCGRVGKTYEATRHRPVSPRELSDPKLLWQSVHDVQQRDETRRLHGRPADLAVDVEARLRRRLALRVPLEDPLRGRDLCDECKYVDANNMRNC
jgi:hypothetical protein